MRRTCIPSNFASRSGVRRHLNYLLCPDRHAKYNQKINIHQTSSCRTWRRLRYEMLCLEQNRTLFSHDDSPLMSRLDSSKRHASVLTEIPRPAPLRLDTPHDFQSRLPLLLWPMVDRRNRTFDGISPPKHDLHHTPSRKIHLMSKGWRGRAPNEHNTASSARPPPTFTHAPAPVHTLLHQHHINFHHTLEVNMVPSVDGFCVWVFGHADRSPSVSATLPCRNDLVTLLAHDGGVCTNAHELYLT